MKTRRKFTNHQQLEWLEAMVNCEAASSIAKRSNTTTSTVRINAFKAANVITSKVDRSFVFPAFLSMAVDNQVANQSIMKTFKRKVNYLDILDHQELPEPDPTPAEMETLLELYVDGADVPTMARTLKYSSNTIRRVLRELSKQAAEAVI